MKKIVFLIIILLAIVAFAGVDYLINKPDMQISRVIDTDNPNEGESEPNFTEILLNTDQNTFGYVIEKRDRVKQIFEKFDLSSVDDIRIYRNMLKKSSSEYADKGVIEMIIYEIRGPKNQGKLTYLDVKLKIIEQMGESENIKETEEYGDKSFFYNDTKNVNTAFLFCQVEDNLFGFQYNKANEENFNTVKEMIKVLTIL